ncbi:MAG: hypothetical protein LUQ13_04965 [Methanomicrobiales archaeon]|nr:hypothetical protein [Methanomicrobiales archaeon]
MHPIASSKKGENGITVQWKEGRDKMSETFSYAELIDMRINATDLVEKPEQYLVDKKAHKILPEKPMCGESIYPR